MESIELRAKDTGHHSSIKLISCHVILLALSFVSTIYYLVKPVGPFEISELDGPILNSWIDHFFLYLLLFSGSGMYLTFLVRNTNWYFRWIANGLLIINTTLYMYYLALQTHLFLNVGTDLIAPEVKVAFTIFISSVITSQCFVIYKFIYKKRK